MTRIQAEAVIILVLGVLLVEITRLLMEVAT